MTDATGRCAKMVPSRDAWTRPSQCQRNAKVVRDGRGYCRQHDPEAVAERDRKRRVKWDIEWARERLVSEGEREAREYIGELAADGDERAVRIRAKLSGRDPDDD